MAPHDWDMVPDKFVLGSDVGAKASSVEPYMTFYDWLP